MTQELATTNVLLGVMAAVSVLEALALVGLLVGGAVFYRRLLHALSDIEDRHLAPAATRVHAILDDVKSVTSKVRGEADRFERFVRWSSDALRRYRRSQATRPN